VLTVGHWHCLLSLNIFCRPFTKWLSSFPGRQNKYKKIKIAKQNKINLSRWCTWTHLHCFSHHRYFVDIAGCCIIVVTFCIVTLNANCLFILFQCDFATADCFCLVVDETFPQCNCFHNTTVTATWTILGQQTTQNLFQVPSLLLFWTVVDRHTLVYWPLFQDNLGDTAPKS